MSVKDYMQVCINGHKINGMTSRHPENNKDFCPKCGAKTIDSCPRCGALIDGDIIVSAAHFPKSVYDYCGECGKPFPWAKNKVQINSIDNTKKGMTINLRKQQDELSKYNTIYDQLEIHPEIKNVSESLFKTEHYSEAIEASFKQIILLIKEKTNYPKDKNNESELDGAKLMREVFNLSKKTPLLKLNSLVTQTDINEQEGFMNIFVGAVQGIRNPKAHANLNLKDPQKAIEYILFASLLARKIDESKLNKKE
ncbi:MAG: TIGR02391 family protein [Candidatus ainarchaeum sp.]|nr:TIGR02391 family protein [Candidatus ainarchaeum sp.]